jgi:hypothetical protein
MAEFGGTAEICKTRIQQPLTAAYEFWQIPADTGLMLSYRNRRVILQHAAGSSFSLNRQAQS